LASFLYLELETANGNPVDEDILNAVDLFVDSYNQLLVTEYDDPFDRRMDKATVESMTPGRRRMDHPQQESRQLQSQNILLFLRISGSCRGCGSSPFFTNQVVGRHRKLFDKNVSDDLRPGVPTEAALLAAYSSRLSSSSGDYGSIVDAVSLDEVSEPYSGKGKGKGRSSKNSHGASKSTKKGSYMTDHPTNDEQIDTNADTTSEQVEDRNGDKKSLDLLFSVALGSSH
jgi:Fe-S cluster biogenesis protein NfuA